MKSLPVSICLFLFININILTAQKIIIPTHTLELTSNNDKINETKNVFFKFQDDVQYISIQLSKAYTTAQIIQINTNNFKFQLSEIKDSDLININFIGIGSISNKISGQYNLSIDGEHRKGMSGTFVISKNMEAIPIRAPQNGIGGHFGVVQGLFFLNDGNLTSIFTPDVDYSIGFPMGITVKKRDNFAFDLELVPFITSKKVENIDVENITLLIHPGLLWGVGNNLTFGTRLAFELGEKGRYGITPLLHFGNIFPSGFIEVVLPIRVGSDTPLSMAIGIHIGMGF